MASHLFLGVCRLQTLNLHATREYLRQNQGIPFLAIAILLIGLVAVSLAAGAEPLANVFSNYGFWLLIVGIVVQFVSFLTELKNFEGISR